MCSGVSLYRLNFDFRSREGHAYEDKVCYMVFIVKVVF